MRMEIVEEEISPRHNYSPNDPNCLKAAVSVF